MYDQCGLYICPRGNNGMITVLLLSALPTYVLPSPFWSCRFSQSLPVSGLLFVYPLLTFTHTNRYTKPGPVCLCVCVCVFFYVMSLELIV